MYKKLFMINIAVILLVTVVYIFGYYFINYPMKFDVWEMLKECKLQYLPAVFIVTALASYLVSSLDFKKLNFKSKFLSVFPFLNMLALAFFIYIAAEGFIKNKRELTKQENYYIIEAQKDIKKDQIVMRYAGGFFLPIADQTTIKKIDSIRKKYGIISQNTGCTIDPIDRKAQEKYSELTDPYLENRNGKDWNERMKKEIDGLKKIKNPGIK
ncbi:FEKKY domain-containing protein [Chryseobacterium herbae]|uniref:Uncharacterized protein n=1 Tax=Chryseobacterium herbae TaxID=2976476 RepID=A0ABT2IQK6_9FLAO|nr:hypothetical protein [Chryseobacterium sp. pc1-10]MCT2561099.1 hypothetical protein [Chryseobacterium sp. pc1-10]